MKDLIDTQNFIFISHMARKFFKQESTKLHEAGKRTGKPKAKLVNLREISEIYSIPLSTLRRWASERKFPLYKISNRIRVSIEEFEEWLSKFRIEGRLN